MEILRDLDLGGEVGLGFGFRFRWRGWPRLLRVWRSAEEVWRFGVGGK